MRLWLFALASLLAAGAAAQESLDEIDQGKAAGAAQSASAPAKSPIAEVNGYVDNRFQYSWVDPGAGPLATSDVPSLQDLLEANVQLKVHLGAKAFLYGDLSLLFQAGGLYYTRSPLGGRARVDDHYVASLLPFMALNELYVSYSPAPFINLLVGKKRIVWGSGFAFNPTDLVNPPKDPTDPNFQRAGAWLARVELPFERFTVSALAAPSVLYTSNGLPSALLKYPDYLPTGQTYRDGDSHYLLAARLYALVYDADINFMYFFSNQYNDGFSNKSRLGASFSRYFFTDYELHVEALFQQGSARTFANHWCVTPGAGAFSPGCADPLKDALVRSKLDDKTIYSRVLVGMRTTFSDESLLSIEYYYQGDGDSDLEFEDTVRGLVVAQKLSGLGLTTPSGSGAAPGRFTFDPLRRHYLILSYTKPKIKDDFTVDATLIAGLRDLSGMLSPTVSWNAKEWLALTLYGFIPIRGIPVGQVGGGDGSSYSEYSLLPFDWRLLFEVRAFY